MGRTEEVAVEPGTLARRAYGRDAAREQFSCSYGLNPAYREQIERSALRVSGTDAAGEVRIVELPGHRFFLGTLFLPQLSSCPGTPHPLIVAYLQAAMTWRKAREA